MPITLFLQTPFCSCRLNYRLTRACEADLNTMCTDVCVEAENEDKACGGTVLRCLADKIDDVTDDNCKQELLYFQKMEVRSAACVTVLLQCPKQFWHSPGATRKSKEPSC